MIFLRFRRVFFPLLLAGLWAVAGCSLSPRYATPEEVAQRQELSDNSVAYAITALESGNKREADTALQQAAGFLFGSGEAYIAVAQKLTERGHPAEAVRFMNEAVKNKSVADPDALFWATLAKAYQKAGDTSGAANANAQAEKAADAVMASLGKAIPKAGSDPATAETARRFLAVGSYYADIKNDASRALRALREARRLSPNNPEVLNALGYTLADKGTTREEFDEAVRLTREAVEILPNTGVVLDSYGWALFKTGDLPGARRVLREAADADGSAAEIRYHLGVVYGQLGLIDEARLELDRATILRKNYKEAADAKAHLKQPPGQGVIEGA